MATKKKDRIIRKTTYENVLVLFIAGMFASFYLLESETLKNSIFTVASVVFSVAVFLLGISENHGKIKVGFRLFYGFAAVFIVFCYLSSLWAMNTHYVYIRSFVIVKTMVCIVLVYMVLDKEISVDILLRGMMIGGYLVVIACIAYYGFDILRAVITSSIRFSGLFINNNVLGMLSANTIIINLYYFIYQRKCKKFLPLIALTVIVLAAAGSRKSILLLLAGVFLLLLSYNRENKKAIKAILRSAVFVVIFIVGLYFLAMSPLFANLQVRFQGLINYYITGEGHVNYSTLVRAELTRLGLRIFKQHPIVGIGIDNARIYGLQLTGRDYYLHNNYAELLADGGIIGFLCYYSMYIYLIYNMIKLRKNRDQEYDICFILLLVHAVMEYGFVAYYLKDTYCYFMLFFLEVGILKRKNRKVRYRDGYKKEYL